LQDEISQWLAQWFLERRKYTEDAVQLLSLNYFEAGLLTSMEVVEFVSEIEDKFGIQFSEEDFRDPRFSTVEGLSQLIAERSAQESQRR
jgi:acyl carrier protein